MATVPKRKPPAPRVPHPDLADMPARLRLALKGRQQKWLAERGEVEESGVSRILNGEALVGVTADTVVRLARALGIDPGWLLCGDGPMHSVVVRVDADASDALKAAVARAAELEPESRRVAPQKRQRPAKHRK